MYRAGHRDCSGQRFECAARYLQRRILLMQRKPAQARQKGYQAVFPGYVALLRVMETLGYSFFSVLFDCRLLLAPLLPLRRGWGWLPLISSILRIKNKSQRRKPYHPQPLLKQEGGLVFAKSKPSRVRHRPRPRRSDRPTPWPISSTQGH